MTSWTRKYPPTAPAATSATPREREGPHPPASRAGPDPGPRRRGERGGPRSAGREVVAGGHRGVRGRREVVGRAAADRQPVERGGQRVGTVVAMARGEREAAVDHRGDRVGHVGRERRRRGAESGERVRGLVVAREREAPGEHLVEQEPDGVDVGAGVGGLARAPAREPDSELVPSTMPVPVRSAAASALAIPKSVTFTAPPGGEQYIRRLHVAVHDAVAVRDVERDRHGPGDADRFGRREAAAARRARAAGSVRRRAPSRCRRGRRPLRCPKVATIPGCATLAAAMAS